AAMLAARSAPTARISSSSRSASHTWKPSAAMPSRVGGRPEPGRRQRPPDVTGLAGVAQPGDHPPPGVGPVPLQEPAPVGGPAHHHDGDAIAGQVVPAPGGQPLDRDPIGGSFDEHDRPDLGVHSIQRRARWAPGASGFRWGTGAPDGLPWRAAMTDRTYIVRTYRDA